MAIGIETYPAEVGTDRKMNSTTDTGCPTWDNLGRGKNLPPFFNPDETLKRKGFVVKFLSDFPRRESQSMFNVNAKELWFDIDHQGQLMTWTISQISLLLELKNQAPLGGKVFHIQLVPVDDAFRERRPKYKGKDRYVITAVDALQEL